MCLRILKQYARHSLTIDEAVTPTHRSLEFIFLQSGPRCEALKLIEDPSVSLAQLTQHLSALSSSLDTCKLDILRCVCLGSTTVYFPFSSFSWI